MMLMSADAPRYKTGEKPKHYKIEDEADLAGLLQKKYK
jgi:hypothetical protein